jgi:hypothetical protein
MAIIEGCTELIIVQTGEKLVSSNGFNFIRGQEELGIFGIEGRKGRKPQLLDFGAVRPNHLIEDDADQIKLLHIIRNRNV